jgi:hypothetical protein
MTPLRHPRAVGFIPSAETSRQVWSGSREAPTHRIGNKVIGGSALRWTHPTAQRCMGLMRRLLLTLAAVLFLPALVAAAAEDGVKDEAAAPLTFRRIFAPADRMGDWPTGEAKYLPLDATEFERLLSRLKAAEGTVPPTPSAQLRRAEYRATLDGDRLLVGTADLEIILTAEPLALLPLEPCSFSIRNPQWNGGKDATPPAAAEGASAAPPKLKAIVGANAQGKLRAVVDRTGNLGFEWSLAGRRDANGELAFSGEIPTAAASSLVLDLPQELAPQINRGLVAESAAAEDRARGDAAPVRKRWRIELGPTNRFDVKLVSGSREPSGGDLPAIRESRIYDLSPRGVDLAARWEIRGRAHSTEQIAVLLDPGLQLVTAKCDEQPVTWTTETLPEGQGGRAVVRLPPSSSTYRSLQLAAIAPLSMDSLWRLPRLRPQGTAWEEGTISIAAASPLSIEQLKPVECSQTAAGPLAAPRVGESAQFRCFKPDATIELAMALRRELVTATVATAVEIGGGEIAARVAGEFQSAGSSQFALEAEVAPSWRIEEVTTTPADAIADWNFESRADADHKLTIRLAKSIGPEQPVRVSVSARRLRLPTEHGMKFQDLQPVRFLPPVESRVWLSLAAVGRNELSIRGNNPPRRAALADQPSTARELFNGTAGELFFDENAAGADAEVLVQSRRPDYSSAIHMEVEAKGGRLQESCSIRCVPGTAPVERVFVRLSEKRETVPRWKLLVPDGVALTARRLSNGGPEAGSAIGPEIWELALSHPQSSPFELQCARDCEFDGPRAVALASMPEASRQSGTLVVRRSAECGIRIENRRLKCLPPEVPSITSIPTAWATYSYDPVRDTDYAKESPFVLSPAAPSQSSGCAWSVLLESWHAPDGLSRCRATWDLQLGDRLQARLTLPEGIDPADLNGVWIDGLAAVWQPILEVKAAAEKTDLSTIVVPIPGQRRFATLAVEFTTRNKPFGATGSIASRLPGIDVPVLSAAWRMWLPVGYDAVAGQASGSPPFVPRETIGNRIWGPLGRTAEQRAFRVFATDDWAALVSDPASKHAQRNLEKAVAALGDALKDAETGDPKTLPLWRNVLRGNAFASLSPPLLVDRLALDRVGVFGETPLHFSATAEATNQIKELLQNSRLALLASSDCVLLTSQVSAALFNRQWTVSDLSVAGTLSPGPLAERLSEASQDQADGRFLPASLWTQLPPKPQSPWIGRYSPGDKPLEMQGWNAVRRELPLHETVAVRFAHRSSFKVAGLVVFLATIAIEWWFLRRWISALLLIAGGFTLTTLVLPDPWAPLASWALLATLFCLVGQLLTRKPPREGAAVPESLGAPLPSAVLERTVLQPGRVPEGAMQGSQNENAQRSSGSSRGSSAAKFFVIAAALASGARMNADESPSRANTPDVSPVYRVFVPADAAKKPVGDKVYLSEAFYSELYRRAAALSDAPQGWLLISADYRGSLIRDPSTGQLAVEQLKAHFDLRTFGRAVRVRIPLRREDAGFLPESARLDGRPVRAEWESAGTALAFDVDEPGDYRVTLELRPAIRKNNGGAGFEVSTPRFSESRLELLLPPDVPAMEVPSASGAVTQETDPPRLAADLGSSNRLAVAWKEDGQPPAAEIDELLWLKVQPGSVLLDARLKTGAAAGRLKSLRLAIDPRLRLQPLSGPDAPTARVQSVSDQSQIIVLDWAQPLPEQASVDLSFLLIGAAGVGNLRLPTFSVEDLRIGKRWLGVSVDSQLEHNTARPAADVPATNEIEALAANEFLKAWGAAACAPTACYRLGAAANWSLGLRPREPLIAAIPVLNLSFDRRQVQLDFAAQLNVTSGYVFQYRLIGPKGLAVQSLSLKKDGAELVNRWTQDSDGAISVFLRVPAEGRQSLQLRGVVPLEDESSLPLPAVRIKDVAAESTLVRVYRRPGALVEVTPPLGATVPLFPGLNAASPITLESPQPGATVISVPGSLNEPERDMNEHGRLVRAFRVSEQSPSLGEANVKPNVPIFASQQLLWLRQEDRQWQTGVDCRIQVVEGVVDQLQFEVSPAWIGPYTASNGAVVEVVDIPGEGRRLNVAPPKAITGEYRVSISGLLKIESGERPVMPDVAIRNARELARWAALPRMLQGQETNWEVGGMQEVDLPNAFSGSIDAKLFDVCEITGEKPQAVLRQQGQSRASPRVALADVRLAWQADGAWRGVATFDLSPGGASNFRLHLPLDSELVAATVDGLPIQPTPLASGDWQLNLNSDRLPQRVAVVYRGTLSTPDRPGMHEFAAPTLADVPVARTLWTIAGPSRFAAGQSAEKEPIGTLEQHWIRFREIAALIDQSAGLFSEDNEETRRWYQLYVRYWANARTAVLREWLPRSPSDRDLAMRAEMESLERRQTLFAERLEMSDVLRQLLAAAPKANEPAEWWAETLFDPAVAARFETAGRLGSLELTFGEAEKSQIPDRIVAALIVLALVAVIIWEIRKDLWGRLTRRWPVANPAAGAALGLAWWFWLSPSALGLAIALVSAASWGWSRWSIRHPQP